MYIPLKVTTDYSMLKSMIKIPNLINFLHENKISACGICDENLYGVLDFYFNCKQNNIKPIIGLSVKIKESFVYLYAMNYNGYKNLLKIHSITQKEEISLSEIDLYHQDILFIVPYHFKDIYYLLANYPYVYLGYSNNLEKESALIITPNAIYINDLRALKKDELKYMEYLDVLRKEPIGNYENNYYCDYEFIDHDKILEVVKLLNVEIPSNERYIPKYKKDEDSHKFLKALAYKGLEKRLNGNITQEYKKRLDYELETICNMGFADYFLIVYDYVLFAKKNNILVGPGRGSAAGSLVSYSIGITDIDPLKYNLMFERFLNPARVTMPDIDIDFDALKREEVINYVKNKYGVKNVALGLTFNTLKSKLVLREIGKILNINNDLIDKFLKSIDSAKSLKENLKNENVQKYLANYSNLKKLYEISIHLENLKKNTSTHAAGVVISSVELDEVIPIHYEQDNLITGVTMEYLEAMGLLKMDFLGLKNLTTIANIINKIDKNILKNMNLEDSKVYQLFQSGKTEGIFQFETPMMRELVKKLKPQKFSDLVAGVALGRPGPKDHVPEFISRKEHKTEVKYIHPDLESILKETYGILIYQEQIIAILGKIAGYSYQEADIIRRAISKKKADVLISEKEKFLRRAEQRGYDLNIALNIYDLIVKFASYGFNKSHSVAYALLAYQMAYLKVYYPALFLAQLLNNGGDFTKNNSYITYLKSCGYKIYKPSINNNYNDYYLENDKLYMPLKIIKNINEEIASKIFINKKEGYTDLFDFCYKNKSFITEGILTNLINAGALDEFNLNHQTLIKNIDSALNYATLQDDSGLIEKPIIVEYPEYDLEKLRLDEINSYGIYLTNHPASKYNGFDITKINDFEKKVFKKIKCYILVEKIRKIKTKNGDEMAFFTGSDETGIFDFTLFPKNYDLLKNVKENEVLEVYGEISKRFDKYSVIVNNIRKVG